MQFLELTKERATVLLNQWFDCIFQVNLKLQMLYVSEKGVFKKTHYTCTHIQNN